MKTMVVLLLLAMTSCGNQAPPKQASQVAPKQSPPVQLVRGPCTIVKSKEGYEQANVGREVLAAIKRGELRYVALSGYGSYVPGIEEWVYKEPEDKQVCWIGNVDMCTQAAEPIGIVAVAYAGAYNRELKQQLKAQHAAQQLTAADQSSAPR